MSDKVKIRRCDKAALMAFALQVAHNLADLQRYTH